MTDDVIRKIVRKEELRDIVSYEDISGLNKSTYSVKLETGKEVVVSWIDDEEKVEDFKIEADVIGMVNEKTGIEVPEIYSEDLSGDDLPPYYVMELIEGYNPDERFKYMPEDVKKHLLRDAGRILAELHNKTSFESVGNFYHGGKGLQLDRKDLWSEVLFESMGHHLTGLQGTFFEHLMPEIESAFESNKHIVDEIEFEPVLVHEDFRPGNLIVRKDEIAAVIDWERALSGHSEYDLFKAERDFIDLKFKTEEIREKYRNHIFDGYRQLRELEDGWERRREFYRFIHVLQDLRVFADNHEKWTETPGETQKVVELFEGRMRDQIRELKEIQR